MSVLTEGAIEYGEQERKYLEEYERRLRHCLDHFRSADSVPTLEQLQTAKLRARGSAAEAAPLAQHAYDAWINRMSAGDDLTTSHGTATEKRSRPEELGHSLVAKIGHVCHRVYRDLGFTMENVNNTRRGYRRKAGRSPQKRKGTPRTPSSIRLMREAMDATAEEARKSNEYAIAISGPGVDVSGVTENVQVVGQIIATILTECGR